MAVATAADWDCHKNQNGEWECVTERKAPPPLPAAPAPAPEKTVLKPFYAEPTPAPKPAKKAEGWTCKAGEETKNWDCALVGPDPQGQAKIMDAEESEGVAVATFDARETQLFRNLVSQLGSDPWAACTYNLGKTADAALKERRNKSPLVADADFSEVFDEEVTTFLGNVDVTRADQHLKADSASYNSVSRSLTAQGNVMYTDSDHAIYADSAFLRLPSDQARLRNSLFILNSVPARGSAQAYYRESKTFARYKEVAYTTCAPGNEDWMLHAAQMKTDQETGRGSARHVWFEFKGVPLLYTPYISFPIDDRRKSGLLAPSLGANEETGADFSLPYYWNIAPNLDATITPRFMTNRGGMLASELRYLTKRSRGAFGFEFLPHDSETKESRGLVTFKDISRITPQLRTDLDLNWVSDEDYLDEIGNVLRLSHTRLLRSHGRLNYNRPGASFSMLLENFQTVDKTIDNRDKPYRRLPQVLLDLDRQLPAWPVRADFHSEYVFFQRSEVNVLRGVPLPERGQRLDLKPSISLPLRNAAAFLVPKFSLDHTQYWLDGTASGQTDSIDRTLPILSLDSGLFLERPFGIGEASYVHTLEPRLFYLYVPFDDQDDIPLFDTSEFDFNFDQLFRENRFSGADRINDANQLTLALTSRLLDSESGRERLRASLGQIFFFEDRRVNLEDAASSVLFVPKTADPDSVTSNLVAELSGLITDSLSFRSALQWNPDGNTFERGQASLHYHTGDNDLFNIGYRFRGDGVGVNNRIEQGDVSLRWPIAAGWHAVGRWLYSLENERTLESFLGVEKESCCWRLRLIGRRFVNRISNDASTDADTQTGIFVQLELKGLTSFGDDVERFLNKNIEGYRISKKK